MGALRSYGLGIAYLLGWLLTWGLHALFTYLVDGYPPHGAPWWLDWLMTSFENLASEYHQVGAFVVLARWLIFKGSPQSRDGDDEMRASIRRIEERLGTLPEPRREGPTTPGQETLEILDEEIREDEERHGPADH